MPKLTFFNLGNADTCRFDLANGQKLLVDYAAMANGEVEDKRADLPTLLREDLEAEERDYFDVVAYSHIDEDHIKGSSEFFWFEHAEKYQDKERIRINDLWVPAAAITEEGTTGEGRIIRQEARYRLLNGERIRVFSRPERLKEFLESNGLNLADRAHLITNAGQLVPGFSKNSAKGVEFFIHCPFAKRLDEVTVEDRNGDSIVFQSTFLVDGVETRVIMSADITHETWGDIVSITRGKKNDHRLEWEVYKLPHHCSYTAIGPDKGEDKTNSTTEVSWLCEEQGSERCIIVSSSDPIPAKGSKEDMNVQPPHRQAAAYYRQDVTGPKDGDFLVTMEHPNALTPKPIVIEISGRGAILRSLAVTGPAVAVSTVPPRAG